MYHTLHDSYVLCYLTAESFQVTDDKVLSILRNKLYLL